MSDNPEIITFNREDWRTFFSGKFHQTLSISISEAYANIFKFCVTSNLIKDPAEAIKSVSSLDVNDLSDTTGLMHIRFMTNFRSNFGDSARPLNLSQMLNAHYKEQRQIFSAAEASKLKTMLRLCRELESICSVLKLGRNINAHVQSEILDTGFTLQMCSAILRLYEIFDFERISQDNVEGIRSRVFATILEGVEKKGKPAPTSLNLDISNENFSSDPVFAPAKICTNEVSSNELKKEFEQIEDDVELDVEIQSSELKRQKLNKLRSEIYTFLDKRLNQSDRKLNLLYGSNLSDVMAFEPKSQEDLRKVLSVKLLLSRQPELSEKQLEKFGQQIVEVFK